MVALPSTIFFARSTRRSRRISSMLIGRSLAVRNGSITVVWLAASAAGAGAFAAAVPLARPPAGCPQTNDAEKTTQPTQAAKMGRHELRLRAIGRAPHGCWRKAVQELNASLEMYEQRLWFLRR